MFSKLRNQKGINFGVRTDVGNRRKGNEDSFYADNELGLWVVADGMGGHACGEVASEIAIKTIQLFISHDAELTDAIQKAHEAIVDAGKNGIGRPGMGTTVVAILVQGSDYEIAWAGDSRAYMWDGELTQLSNDHSLVQMLVNEGKLTEAQVKVHPQKSLIYENLGAPEVETVGVEKITGKLKKGQRILLCSDGLSDELTSHEIELQFDNSRSNQEIADSLVDTVLRGPALDNTTVIVLSLAE